MIRMRKLIATLLISCISVSIAHASNSTTLSLQASGASGGIYIPGKSVTLTATLSGGPFLVMNPDGSGSGTLTFMDGNTVIQKVTILNTQHNSISELDQQCYYITGSIPSCTYYFSTDAVYSFKYTLPKIMGLKNFSVTFSGDKYANGSGSPMVSIKAFYPNIVPVVNLLFNN